jgi:hypothetical protein
MGACKAFPKLGRRRRIIGKWGGLKGGVVVEGLGGLGGEGRCCLSSSSVGAEELGVDAALRMRRIVVVGYQCTKDMGSRRRRDSRSEERGEAAMVADSVFVLEEEGCSLSGTETRKSRPFIFLGLYLLSAQLREPIGVDVYVGC